MSTVCLQSLGPFTIVPNLSRLARIDNRIDCEDKNTYIAVPFPQWAAVARATITGFCRV